MIDVGARAAHLGTPSVELVNVSHAFLQGCFAPVGGETFLSVRGRETRAIYVGESDLSGARTPVTIGADVPQGAVTRR